MRRGEETGSLPSHGSRLNAALRPAATRGRALLGEDAPGGHLRRRRVLFSQKES